MMCRLAPLLTPNLARSSHLNSSTPFDINEYDAVYVNPPYAPYGLTKYPDWDIGNDLDTNCTIARFWDNDGSRIDPKVVARTDGKVNTCKASEFDQYGDTEAFGVQ